MRLEVKVSWQMQHISYDSSQLHQPHPPINVPAKLWQPCSWAQRVRGLVPARPLELRGSPRLWVTRLEPRCSGSAVSGGWSSPLVMSTGGLLCIDTSEFIKLELTTPWLPWWLGDKQSACQCRRSGLGRSPGGGTGNLLRYPCLGNPMDRGAWHVTAHGATKSQTLLSDETTIWHQVRV